MSIEEKMQNAKETSWLTEGLTKEEIFEAVLEGRLIAELEKIKAEIHKLAFDDDGEYIGVIDNDDAMDLIDNRISELKGEQE